MANQTYDLTQTGQEVQNIINDANGVKNAAAQTTLTTDYVMLKDTSGNYHKIDKSSFTEAIRDTLATLLTNNDKGTTFDLVPAIASGDFGSVTPENLASVLGAEAWDFTLEAGAYQDIMLNSRVVLLRTGYGGKFCMVYTKGNSPYTETLAGDPASMNLSFGMGTNWTYLRITNTGSSSVTVSAKIII